MGLKLCHSLYTWAVTRAEMEHSKVEYIVKSGQVSKFMHPCLHGIKIM